MLTSSGYHTFNICQRLTLAEGKELYMNFRNYGEVNIFQIAKNKVATTEDKFIKQLYSTTPKYYIINYYNKYKGLSWVLRLSNKSPGFINNISDEDKPCSIKAKINPKLFTGIKDYVSAANADYLLNVEANFNIEAEKISPILGRFDLYSLNRMDYCINFSLNELEIYHPPELIMSLMKRSYTPAHYKPWMEYDKGSHRKTTDKYSFYLKSNSVNINCYLKHHQLQKQFSDCPNIEDARNVIRFEIQCKYPKIYSMSKILKCKSGFKNLIYEMLSDDACTDIISKYFNRIICKGDYYTLECARRIIESYKFRLKKEDRLIKALTLINQCRGISKAKDTLQGETLEDFRQSLRELAEIGINPVTIPKEWGIKRIPNLLDAYYNKIADEQAKELSDKISHDLVTEYFTKHKRIS